MTVLAPSAPEVGDVAAGVTALLAQRLSDGTSIALTTPERVFGGNARQAWACTASWDDESGRHAEDLILLVRSAGSQVSTDPEGEFAILDGLAQQGVRAPRIWGHDPDGRLLGGAAVLLQRLAGRTDAVEYLRADPALGRARTLDLARALAELHAAALPAVPVGGSQLRDWRRLFEEARREPYPALSWLFDWLEDHQADPAGPTVVHGDFRPGNILYDGERIVGILDWELAHVGDPLEDVAWAYRSLWSPERFVPIEEFVAVYEAAGGVRVAPEALRWHRIFSELRFAVISLRASASFAVGGSHSLRLIDRARTVIPSLGRCLRWVAETDEYETTSGEERGVRC